MNYQLERQIDEVAASLRRTADLLTAHRARLERLVDRARRPAGGKPPAPGRPAPKPARGPELSPPFHWQADGAGDERAG
jgi:hypothetical protein